MAPCLPVSEPDEREDMKKLLGEHFGLSRTDAERVQAESAESYLMGQLSYLGKSLQAWKEKEGWDEEQLEAMALHVDRIKGWATKALEARALYENHQGVEATHAEYGMKSLNSSEL